MEIDREKIEAAIVREAADRIISDDDLYERVKRDVDTRIDKLFATRVEERLSEVVNETIRAGFDRQYQKRDSFGRPIGEPTTISQELERLVDGYWNTRVDRNGKPTSDSYNTTTRAEWLMASICAEDFQKTVKQHAVNVTGQLKDSLRRELQGAVNRMLSELFHVRSADDQAGNPLHSSSIHPETKKVVAGD